MYIYIYLCIYIYLYIYIYMHYFLEFIGCYNGLIYQHIGCATLVALNSQAFFWGLICSVQTPMVVNLVRCFSKPDFF